MPVVTQIGIVLLWLSALLTLYTGWDYFHAGLHHLIRRMREGPLLRLGARARRQGRGRYRSAGRVATVADLIAWLARRGEDYAYAFENPKVIRAAIDHSHVRADAPIAGAQRDRLLSADDGG